jgi:hypothetical protein
MQLPEYRQPFVPFVYLEYQLPTMPNQLPGHPDDIPNHMNKPLPHRPPDTVTTGEKALTTRQTF